MYTCCSVDMIMNVGTMVLMIMYMNAVSGVRMCTCMICIHHVYGYEYGYDYWYYYVYGYCCGYGIFDEHVHDYDSNMVTCTCIIWMYHDTIVCTVICICSVCIMYMVMVMNMIVDITIVSMSCMASNITMVGCIVMRIHAIMMITRVVIMSIV